MFNSLAYKLFIDIGLRERVPFWYYRGFAHYLSGYTEPKDFIAIGAVEAMIGRLQGLINPDRRFKPIDVVDIMSRKSFNHRVTGEALSRRHRLKVGAQAFV